MNRHSAARGGQHRAARRANLMRRRSAAVVLGIVGVAGLGIASAAQLNVASRSLGAGTATVASCQGATPITVSFTTAWSTTPTPASYRATEVRLSSVNATCAGKTYQIQLVGTNGLALNPELSATVTLTGDVLTVPIPSTPASNIGGVAVVIRS